MRKLIPLFILCACSKQVQTQTPEPNYLEDKVFLCGLLVQHWTTERSLIYVGENQFADLDKEEVFEMPMFIESCDWALEMERERVQRLRFMLQGHGVDNE